MYVNFPIFRVCFMFCIGFSCLYRYTRNKKHEVFVFRVPKLSLQLGYKLSYAASFTSIRSICTSRAGTSHTEYAYLSTTHSVHNKLIFLIHYRKSTPYEYSTACVQKCCTTRIVYYKVHMAVRTRTECKKQHESEQCNY